MSDQSKTSSIKHPLTAEGIVRAALRIADASGLSALSMRRLGRELGVEAMAIYYHFANKEQIVDEMLGVVHDEISVATSAIDWKYYMRARATRVLEVLSCHPWAAGMMESGTNPTAATLRDREQMTRYLRQAGFSIEATVHAITLLDVYIYGAAQQYIALSFTTADQATKISEGVAQNISPADHPYFYEILMQCLLAGKYQPLDEFVFGLEIVIDGIDRLKDA